VCDLLSLINYITQLKHLSTNRINRISPTAPDRQGYSASAPMMAVASRLW
jgi:hypothetical protein